MNGTKARKQHLAFSYAVKTLQGFLIHPCISLALGVLALASTRAFDIDLIAEDGGNACLARTRNLPRRDLPIHPCIGRKAPAFLRFAADKTIVSAILP